MMWELWRQDDNGNRFLIGQFSSSGAAQIRLAELSAVQHKQCYWVSAATEHPEEASGPPGSG